MLSTCLHKSQINLTNFNVKPLTFLATSQKHTPQKNTIHFIKDLGTTLHIFPLQTLNFSARTHDKQTID